VKSKMIKDRRIDLKGIKAFAFQSLIRANRGKVDFSDVVTSLRLWQSYSRKMTIASAVAFPFKTILKTPGILQAFYRSYTRFKMTNKIPAGHKLTTGTKFISIPDKLHKFVYCLAASEVGFSLTTFFLIIS
jgi:hypothetical protein